MPKPTRRPRFFADIRGALAERGRRLRIDGRIRTAGERRLELLEDRAVPAFGLPTGVSVIPSGASTASSSSSATARSLSNDGRYQAFVSSANNLVLGLSDLNSVSDVFVRDLWTGQTAAVSVNSAGSATGNASASSPVISGNGRYVVFLSAATDLVATPVAGAQLFRRDLQTSTTSLVTINSAGTAGVTSLSASRFTVSDDGRFISFEGNALNAVNLPDANGGGDIYLRDMLAANCTLVSVNSAGTAAGNDTSFRSTISADGSTVIFRSDARDLIPNGPVYVNSSGNIYARAVATGVTSLVTQLSQDAGTGAGASYFNANSVSADGRYMVFISSAYNLIANTIDTQADDVFLHDRVTGINTLVSRNSAGTGSGSSSSAQPAISADGNFVVFTSSSNNMTATPSSGFAQVYRWNRATQTTEMVSLNSAGTAGGNQNSTVPGLSADGRYVVFASTASNLTGIVDANAAGDIFVRDMQTGVTSLVSVNNAGSGSGNASSFDPRISASGTRIAFASAASNLGTNLTDGNSSIDVFVRDTVANTTVAVNTIPGDTANGFSQTYNSESRQVISSDGRYLVFNSSANNLVSGILDTNGTNDIFLKDLVSGTISYLTINASSQPVGGGARAISRDGRYVVFEAESAITATPHASSRQIYRRDLQTSTTVMVSLNSAGTSGSNNWCGGLLSISDDGRFVAFVSQSTDLVAGLTDANGQRDVFVRDMQTGTTTCISVTTGGTTTGNTESINPLISANGSRVVFSSLATDLTTAVDANGNPDLFVRTLGTNSTALVSVSTGGAAGNNYTFDSRMSISADGTKIAFWSRASNLTTGDANGQDDVFFRDVVAGTTTLISVNSAGSGSANNASYPGSMNAAGTLVVFSSSASNVLPGDANGQSDVFLRNVATNTTTLVSRNSAGTGSANGGSSQPTISDDGTKVAFRSDATDLTSLADTNLGSDIFWRNLSTNSTTLASTNSTGAATANQYAFEYVFSNDGSRIAFDTYSTDHFAGIDDLNGTADIVGFATATSVKTLVTSTVEGGFTAQFGCDTPGLSANGAKATFLKSGQLYVYDVASGGSVLVSVNSSGSGTANAQIFSPTMSADGNLIVFQTGATNLSPLDADASYDIYARNVTAGTTTLVSVNSAGTGPSVVGAINPIVSPNGAKIAFSSSAANLTSVPDANGTRDAFVRDLLAGTTKLVTVNSAGTAAGDGIYFGDGGGFSDDGTYFAFDSGATNLVAAPFDFNGTAQDVFFRNLSTDTTTVISVHAPGVFGLFTNSDYFPSVSADGTRVAFVAYQGISLTTVRASSGAVYVRDLAANVTHLVSVNSAGVGVAGFGDPTISGNGQVVVFQSNEATIVGGDSNGSIDIFVRDLAAGTTTAASINTSGSGTGSTGSFGHSVSFNGNWVGFESNATNLSLTPDANGNRDVFVRDRAGATTYLLSRNSAGSASGFSSSAIVASDGSTVVFTSTATNLVAGLTDANGASNDLFANFRDAAAVLDVVDIAPDPRGTPVASIDVVFSRVINLATFDFSDVTLTLNGGPNLMTNAQTVTYVAGSTYRINNLAGLTAASGVYVLTVTGNLIQDVGGNGCIGSANDSWTTNADTTPPTIAALGPIVPNPRNTPVDSVVVVFSEPINLATFDFSDIALTLDGGPNLITNTVTTTHISGNAYQINGLTGLTGVGGLYQLTVAMANVQDLAGNNGLGSSFTTWTLDVAPPQVNSFAPIASPRPDPVATVDVELSEQVDLGTFDFSDLSLTLNGGANLIDNTVTIEYVPSLGGATYRIGNLGPLTAAGGAYQLTVDLTNVLDLAGNAGSGSSAANWATDTIAPKIAGVFFDGSTWSPTFRAAAGNAIYGYPAQTGAAQLTSMPWSTINTIYIQFSENVVVDNSQLSLRGSNVLTYATSMTYDSVNFVAKFTLASPFDTDRVILDLDGDGGAPTEDLAGNPLAGSWAQSVDVFPTAGPAGVDFKFRFVVAVGDADRNNLLRNADLNQVRNQLFIDVGAGGYSIFADIDGNGVTRNADLNATRNHLFVDPPAGPGPFRAASRTGGERSASRRVSPALFASSSASDSVRQSATPRRPSAPAAAVDALDALFGET